MLATEMIEKARAADLLALVGADTRLKRVASTGGGEYAGACPFCGGRDRFRMQPKRRLWLCRNCTEGKWQDPISYVERREHLSFTEAVERLAGEMPRAEFRPAPAAPEPERREGPPAPEWQRVAKSLIDRAEAALWSDAGSKAREWLRARGLMDETLRSWQIGFNPEDRQVLGMGFYARGIVIPCLVGGAVWYVKVRRATGKPKYLQLKGGCPALYGADTLEASNYAVITEGEFDALIAWQSLHEAEREELRRAGVATFGSASTSPDPVVWFEYLAPVSTFLICYDADAAGVRAAEHWLTLTRRARRVMVPKLRELDKDLTDYHRSGGRILDLIAFEIERDQVEHGARDAEGEAWGRVTLTLQPGTAAYDMPTVAGYWTRLGDGSIEASYTPEELRLCLQLAGADLGPAPNKLA